MHKSLKTWVCFSAISIPHAWCVSCLLLALQKLPFSVNLSSVSVWEELVPEATHQKPDNGHPTLNTLAHPILFLQFDVSEKTYWFKFEVKGKYIFLKEQVAAPVRVPPQSHIAFYSAVSPAIPLPKFPLMSSLDVVLDAVIQSTHLDEAGRKELFNQQRCLHSKNWSKPYLVPQHSVIP